MESIEFRIWDFYGCVKLRDTHGPQKILGLSRKPWTLRYFSASCSETHPLHTVHRPSSGKCVDLAWLASHRRLASWICGFARKKKRHKGLEVVLCPVNHPEPYWPMITPWIARIACSRQLHADFFMFNGWWFVGKTAGLVFKAASPESANRGWIAGWSNRLIQLAVKTDHLPNIHRINATHSLPADLYMSNTLKATGKTTTKKMSSINTSVGFQTMPRNTKQNQQKMSSFCHWRNSAAVQFLPRVRMKAKMPEITTKNWIILNNSQIQTPPSSRS